MCVFAYPVRAGEESKRGPPHFSLSIILHARRTHGDMPERVSISPLFLCVCVPALLCLPKECSSLYLYVWLVITYSLYTHACRGRRSLKARAILHLLKTHNKLECSAM